MKHTWLDLCLYPQVKLHILQHFIRNPGLKNNQSQIARAIETSQVSISRNIKDLVTLKILMEERSGPSAIYFLNPESVFIKNIFLPMIQSNRMLIPNFVEQGLNPLLKTIKRRVVKVILFGSAARGELRPNSDVDLLATVDRKDSRLISELHDALIGAGNRVGLRINLLIEENRTFERNRSIPYLQSVRREGIVVWKRGPG